MEKDEITKKVGEVLDLVRLHGLGARYPNQLSGGQQQRVALARALIFNPSILLMDEPLGALDRNLREQMQLEIRRLHRTLGITVLYVTHDQEEALVMSDRVAVMNKGRIEQLASPTHIYENPANTFVADFIGESVLFEARVVKQDRENKTYLLRDMNGLEIMAPWTSEIPNGTQVYIAIRPSRFFVLAQGESPANVNVYNGVVQEVIFSGEVTRYRLNLDGCTTVSLKEINRGETQRLEPGDYVRVGCSKKDVKVLAKEEPESEESLRLDE
jgi:putative spermidine/putrescine transport system ATP-binding protein